MRSLFVRVFLWFWLTLVVVVAVIVVSSPFFTRNRPGVARWEQHAQRRALAYVDHLVETVAEEGLDALDRRSERPEGRRGGGGPNPPRVLVFDPTGVEKTGRRADRDAWNLAKRAFDASETVSQRLGSHHLIASPTTDPSGESLVVVVTLRRPPTLIDLLEPKVLVPRILLLAAVAGLLVLWLAYQLSSPVSALRAATRRLASGDLGARVGPPISNRKDEIGQLAEDFDDMAGRIEAQVESQRRLLRDVSHELRSPLARLNVALGLARKQVPDRALASLDRIETECDRLNEMIGHLLDLSRHDEELAQTDVFDVAQLVGEVVDDARFEAGPQAVELTGATAAAIMVRGARDLLRSAFENVLRNALSFSPEGTSVVVDVDLAEPSVIVTIADRGPGVPEEDLDRIFKPFFRVELARDRRQGGSGLGLAIAERAVSRHGGTISARNREGGGLAVEVRLPVVRGES
jgi:two-component system sensor histidine kinase CpxA